MQEGSKRSDNQYVYLKLQLLLATRQNSGELIFHYATVHTTRYSSRT